MTTSDIFLKHSSKGGNTTKERYGKQFFSLCIKIRHEKDPKKKAALRKKIAALVKAKRKFASK